MFTFKMKQRILSSLGMTTYINLSKLLWASITFKKCQNASYGSGTVNRKVIHYVLVVETHYSFPRWIMSTIYWALTKRHVASYSFLAYVNLRTEMHIHFAGQNDVSPEDVPEMAQDAPEIPKSPPSNRKTVGHSRKTVGNSRKTVGNSRKTVGNSRKTVGNSRKQ